MNPIPPLDKASGAATALPPPPSDTPLPDPISRICIPHILDIVTVSSPHHLRLINAHQDIARADYASPNSLLIPLLSATQFHTPALTPSFSLAFTTSAGNPDYPARLRRVEENLKQPLSQDQLDQLADLVWSDLTPELLAPRLVRLLAPQFLALRPTTTIPDDILAAMAHMHPAAISGPLQYLRARRARRKIELWVSDLDEFRDERNIVDVVHDLVNIYLGLTQALLLLRDIPRGKDLHTHLCENPVLPASVRTPIRDTTVGGLFPEDAPLTKDRTIIIMKNGEAAKETHDMSFVFGMGSEKRVCPFKNMFMDTCKTLVERRVSDTTQTQ